MGAGKSIRQLLLGLQADQVAAVEMGNARIQEMLLHFCNSSLIGIGDGMWTLKESEDAESHPGS